MIGNLFCALILSYLLWLAVAEVRGYRIASVRADEGEYPRQRLIRRLSLGGLVAAILLAVRFQPVLEPVHELAWYGLCFVGALVALWIAFRDLHETSLAVIREHERFRQEAEREVGQIAPKRKARGDR